MAIRTIDTITTITTTSSPASVAIVVCIVLLPLIVFIGIISIVICASGGCSKESIAQGSKLFAESAAALNEAINRPVSHSTVMHRTTTVIDDDEIDSNTMPSTVIHNIHHHPRPFAFSRRDIFSRTI